MASSNSIVYMKQLRAGWFILAHSSKRHSTSQERNGSKQPTAWRGVAGTHHHFCRTGTIKRAVEGGLDATPVTPAIPFPPGFIWMIWQASSVFHFFSHGSMCILSEAVHLVGEDDLASCRRALIWCRANEPLCFSIRASK